MALIELTGIERTFQLGDATVHALAGLDLQIDNGEYVAVMGPSGSGKSTLLNLLGLLDRPNAGSYRLEGRDVTTLSPDEQARTVDVEVDFVDPEAAGKLLVGYSADVEIILAGRDNVLRIPTAAIQEGGKVLRFDDASGRLEERKVKAGLANWEYTEVVDGLAAGDRIVISLEKEGIKAGAKVRPADKAGK